jgi:hypothetical protein
VKFAQWNAMYHFLDLHDQFSYLQPEALSHEIRIQNTVRVLNELQADASCMVEWYGNREGPYILSEKKDLVQLFLKAGEDLKTLVKGLSVEATKKSAKSEAEKLDSLVTQINGALNFNEKTVPQNLVSQLNALRTEAFQSRQEIPDSVIKGLDNLVDRAHTLAIADKVYFLSEAKGANYSYRIYQKKSGQSIDDEGKIGALLEPAKQDPESKAFSLMIVYDKNKFDEVESGLPELFTVEGDKPGSIDNQNVAVRRLKIKGTDIKIDLICTHFKSKFDGLNTRVNHGKTINRYIQARRKEDSAINFLLLGDLNTEIGEIAFDLNAQLFRANDAPTVLDLDYKPYSVYSPATYAKALERRINFNQNQINQFTDWAKTAKGSEGKDKELLATKKTLGKFKQALEAVHDADYKELWVELTKFATQNKVRNGEIDFQRPELREALRQLMLANPDLKSFVDKQIGDWAQNNKESDSFDGYRKWERKRREVEFASVTDFIGRYVKTHPIKNSATRSPYISFKIRELKFKLGENMDDYLLRYLVELCMSKHKIDFALLNSYNDAKLVSAKSVSDYWTIMSTGAPNDKFGSDHIPTFLELEFSKALFRKEDLRALGKPVADFESEYEMNFTNPKWGEIERPKGVGQMMLV